MSHGSGINVVILAAGEGTRMKSDTSKVLFPVCGRPMIDYVLNAALELAPDKIVIVLGHKGQEILDHVTSTWAEGKVDVCPIEFTWQTQQLGTGHAVKCALCGISSECEDVMILYGDTPLITGQMLREFARSHSACGSDLSVITTTLEDPGSYGRVVRDKEGNILRIVEASDISDRDEERREVNSGIYLVKRRILSELLPSLRNKNAKQEFYLTDIVEMAAKDGLKVLPFVWQDNTAVCGVNNRYDLAYAESQVRQRILEELCSLGVTIRDPQNTYVDYGVEVGKDTIIEPNSFLVGSTRIGERCVIGPSSYIVDSCVADGSRVWMSVIEDSEIGENVEIGPYSHIRPKCVIESQVTIGNFAEVKNCVIEQGSKVHHHSYLGDCFVGSYVNIGAGTVTVNYDGVKKHQTVIDDGAFVGCNANLVAPLRIGKDAFVAAGSTITSDVPDGSLGIARQWQTNKDGWVSKRKKQED